MLFANRPFSKTEWAAISLLLIISGKSYAQDADPAKEKLGTPPTSRFVSASSSPPGYVVELTSIHMVPTQQVKVTRDYSYLAAQIIANQNRGQPIQLAGNYRAPNCQLGLKIQIDPKLLKKNKKANDVVVRIASTYRLTNSKDAASRCEVLFARFDSPALERNRGEDDHFLYVYLPEGDQHRLKKLEGNLEIIPAIREWVEVDARELKKPTKKKGKATGSQFVIHPLERKGSSAFLKAEIPVPQVNGRNVQPTDDPQIVQQIVDQAALRTYQAIVIGNDGKRYASESVQATEPDPQTPPQSTDDNQNGQLGNVELSLSPEIYFLFENFPEGVEPLSIRLEFVQRNGESAYLPFSFDDLSAVKFTPWR